MRDARGPTSRRTVGRVASICGAPPAEALSGVAARSYRDVSLYWGVCAVTLYWDPVLGSIQKEGVVGKLPDRDTKRFEATSRSVTPRSAALLRSTLTSRFGWSKTWCTRRSTAPGTLRIRSSSRFAYLRLPSRLKPEIWMSSEIGRPKLRIWLTMSAGGESDSVDV